MTSRALRRLKPQPAQDTEPVPTVPSATPDAAAKAQAAREAAAQARERAANTAAAAEARARQILAEAQQQVLDLEADARAAEADAEEWQEAADRDAAIVSTEAEAATLEAARDRLARDIQTLDAEAARIEARLAELTVTQDQAQRQRADAVRADDEAGLRDALTTLATLAELAHARTADLTAARHQAEASRAQHQDASEQLGRARLRLLALRRDAVGLPPAEETLAVAMGLLPALVVSMMREQPDKLTAVMLASVPEDQRPVMAEAIRLAPANPRGAISLASTAAGTVLGAQILASVERLALDDPAQYESIKRTAFEPAAVESPVPTGPIEIVYNLFAAGGAR